MHIRMKLLTTIFFAFFVCMQCIAAPGKLVIKKLPNIKLTDYYPTYTLDKIYSPSPIILSGNRYLLDGSIAIGVNGGSDYFGFLILKDGKVTRILPLAAAQSLRTQFSSGILNAGISFDGSKGFAWNLDKLCQVDLNSLVQSCISVKTAPVIMSGDIVTASYDESLGKVVVFTKSGLNTDVQTELFEYAVNDDNTATLIDQTDPQYTSEKRSNNSISPTNHFAAVQSTVLYAMSDGYYSLKMNPSSGTGMKMFFPYPLNDSIYYGNFIDISRSTVVTKSTQNSSFQTFNLSTGIKKPLRKGGWRVNKKDQIIAFEQGENDKGNRIVYFNKNAALPKQTYQYRYMSASAKNDKVCDSNTFNYYKEPRGAYGFDSSDTLYLAGGNLGEIAIRKFKKKNC